MTGCKCFYLNVAYHASCFTGLAHLFYILCNPAYPCLLEIGVYR